MEPQWHGRRDELIESLVHDFPLDRFQLEAADAVSAGRNVLVAAPTGSGKTVVGELAVAAALTDGGRAFYTAPIKALSNQKFNDLRAVLGPARVGLLTGDHAINGDAPVVVMTTEVLRNMVYSRPESLHDLRWVVLDEVHFLQDTYRGPVWEEVLIHTPAAVRFACLSATVSNAAELGDWVESLRGPTTTVIEHHRPVELEPIYMVGDRHAERDHLVPLLIDGSPNPEGGRFDAEPNSSRAGQSRGRPPRRRFRTPRRIEVAERLAEDGLLPAIYFIFSRKGCDESAARCLDGGLRLTTTDEATRIRAIAESHAMDLDDSDLDVLGYDRWSETLALGVAAHHAGMVPAFREAVEECFVQGLVKVVFATETLALGINMPARSVVIERLTKFTGDGHDILTPSQFTQLTGRAGRRGIDEHGTAVVLWSPFLPFARVAELAASREFPLQSVFRPTYNMAVNLVDRHGPEEARSVLARSFAQFQADRSVSGMRVRREQRVADLERVREELSSMEGGAIDPATAASFLGLVTEEQRLRRHGPGSKSAIEHSLALLAPGDVIERQTEKGPRLLLVLATAQRKHSTRIEAITPRGSVVRIDASAAAEPLEALGHVQLPVPFTPHDQGFRREAAARLRRVNRKRLRRPTRVDTSPEAEAWAAARDAADTHVLADHARREEILEGARRVRRAERDLAELDRRVGRKGTDLVTRFEAVLGALAEFGHVDGWALTDAGRRLRRIYHESDLLVSLAVGEGLFDDLDPASMASLVSCLTHEHRSSEPPPPPRLPSQDLQERFGVMDDLANELARHERGAGLTETRRPSAGFSRCAHRWAGGQRLEDVLEEDMSGGDFVRNAKQLIDLLRQVAEVAPGETGRVARAASELLRRDVVQSGGGPR